MAIFNQNRNPFIGGFADANPAGASVLAQPQLLPQPQPQQPQAQSSSRRGGFLQSLFSGGDGSDPQGMTGMLSNRPRAAQNGSSWSNGSWSPSGVNAVTAQPQPAQPVAPPVVPPVAQPLTPPVQPPASATGTAPDPGSAAAMADLQAQLNQHVINSAQLGVPDSGGRGVYTGYANAPGAVDAIQALANYRAQANQDYAAGKPIGMPQTLGQTIAGIGAPAPA
jgi:hypothetical protein